MSDYELIKITLDEFARLQTYMLGTEKTADIYQVMYDRYAELKALLTALKVNLSELDHISNDR